MVLLGIIRVLTTESQQLLQEHSVILNQRKRITSESRCIAGQPLGIYSDETLMEAVPKIIQLAKSWAEEGKVQAITISCAADPALALCRQTVSVPVIGAGEAGAYQACMVSNKIGVLGLTQEMPELMKSIIGNRLVGHAVPEGVKNTTDLLKDGFEARALEAARGLVQKGATAILFACTGYSTIHLKETLQKDIAIPIIDLVEAQGMAYSIISQ